MFPYLLIGVPISMVSMDTEAHLSFSFQVFIYCDLFQLFLFDYLLQWPYCCLFVFIYCFSTEKVNKVVPYLQRASHLDRYRMITNHSSIAFINCIIGRRILLTDKHFTAKQWGGRLTWKTISTYSPSKDFLKSVLGNLCSCQQRAA